MTVPITIVILTKNEADTIARALRSVAFCDEVIIVDGYSTDETLDIAKKVRKENLLIIKDKTDDDFAKLRNVGLKEARHDWVFFLDTDEEVSSGLAHEIESKIHDEHVMGYFLKRRDYFLGKWLQYGETAGVKLLKLGKKSAGIWRRNVHEVWEIDGSVGELHEPLLHYPHPTIAEFLERINRWTDLDAKVFYDQGVRAHWFTILAYPVGKFVRNYILKLGFLDGMPGLLMAVIMSFHSFLTRAKLYMLARKSPSF